MAYVLVDNFSAGVDRSRPRYVGAPGSLWSGINGHLTRGGDFEKRKAFAVHATLPAGTFGLAKTSAGLYTFGSAAAPAMPAGVSYMRLQHPTNVARTMTGVFSWDLYNGKIYAVADFSDGSRHHYYDGTLVQNWEEGRVVADFADNAGIAEHLRALIDAHASYTATRVGAVITITGATGASFTISAITENGGATNDQAIAVATTQQAQGGITAVSATGSFRVTGGTAGAGVNKITSVKVDGVEILNVAIDWTTSNSVTAGLIAAQINTYNSTPEYTATAVGDKVVITASTTGTGPNGFVVATTPAGTMTTGDHVNMSGGVAAVSGLPQISTATISGTFEVGDKFNIALASVNFGYVSKPTAVGSIVRTHRRKVYSPVGSILWMTQIDTATGLNTDNGASFQNMSTHQSGSDSVTAMGTFNDLLAIFARRVIQLWSMVDDPDLNAPTQFLRETGTRARRSAIGFGDIDCFYLSDSGIRSIRARTGSNLAGVNDVGTPIDSLVRDYLATISDVDVQQAVAIVEPVDGRYWLAVGERVFVFSYFPAKKISAWSWYEPGVKFTDLVTVDDRVYARAGDTIYSYGGASNSTYDSCRVTAELPFLSGGKPGTFKYLKGMDIASTGTWTCDILVDPDDESQYVQLGDVEGVTWPDEGIAVPARVTHMAPRLINESSGYASLSQIGIFTDGAQEKI